MERIGERLKRRREELGFSLADVSRVTNFRPDTIRAVEEGEPGVFPAEAYLKAVLTAYARALGLDAQEIVRGQRSEEERVRDALRGIRLRPRRRLPSRRTFVWVALVVAAVVIGLLVLGRFVSMRSAESAGATPLEGGPGYGDRPARAAGDMSRVDGPGSGGEPEKTEAGPQSGARTETEAQDQSPQRRVGRLEIAVHGRWTRTKLLTGDSVLIDGWLEDGYRDTFSSTLPFHFEHISDRDVITLSLNGEPVPVPESENKDVYDFWVSW
jgi:transcriptional regulator with XRE-family HTH domain